MHLTLLPTAGRHLPMVGSLLLLGLPAGTQPAAPQPTALPPGRMVDVDGYRLHLHCTGRGRPTVVLLSGAGSTAAVWNRVQPAVAKFTRVCSYDRAGEGASEARPGGSIPGPHRASLQQSVNELHRLLLNARVPGPYVLVGASWGGHIARVYADQHPEQVAGMVLVDASHEDGFFFLNGKIIRPRTLSSEEARTLNHEGAKADAELVYATREHRPHPLGDRPLIVLSRGAGGYPEGFGRSPDELNEERKKLQADLARLSRNSHQIIAEKSGHQIHQDDPALVVRAIRQVVEAARRGGRLSATAAGNLATD